jgi:hypothetical protein
MSAVDRGIAVVAITIPTGKIASGKYLLVINIANAASAETTTLQTDLELMK